ncbi:MAG: hypothetical protein MH252_03660 [Thermosynechococcaceae cyanobacterium MS004]|nr:hypothetical protein [Thermosynechococcaceae cyanobacterium MS004]
MPLRLLNETDDLSLAFVVQLTPTGGAICHDVILTTGGADEVGFHSDTFMDEFIRILQTGEINTGDWLLQFATIKSIPQFRNLEADHCQKAYDLALEQDAVCFEVDANYDLMEIYHTEGEVGSFGFHGEMTYGEYWQQFPEERMERPEPCWQIWILLCVAPLMHLHSPIHDQMIVAEYLYYQEEQYFLAMTLAPTNPSDDPKIIFRPDPLKPLVLKPGKIVPSQPGDGSAAVKTWQLGEATILTNTTKFPKIPQSLRTWAWAWRKTCGPVYLIVYLKSDPDLDQTASALANWFTKLTLPKYCPVHDFWFQADGIIQSDYWLQIEQHEETIRFAQGSADKPDSTVNFYDSCIWLTSLWGQNNPADSGFLAAILTGELGEVWWDLVDGEYHTIQACGYDLTSLRNYLDPNNDAAKQLAYWKETIYHKILATTAQTWQQVAEIIAEHLQIPLPQDDVSVALQTWLAQTLPSQRPRRITVYLETETGLIKDNDLQNLLEQLNNTPSESPSTKWKLDNYSIHPSLRQPT